MDSSREGKFSFASADFSFDLEEQLEKPASLASRPDRRFRVRHFGLGASINKKFAKN